MKYLLLAYVDEQLWGALPAAEREALDDECLDNELALRASGHLLAAERLSAGSLATSVRVRRGRLAISDRPFVATDQQLIGLFFVEARDLNEAILVASKLPLARLGGVEVRPIAKAEYGL